MISSTMLVSVALEQSTAKIYGEFMGFTAHKVKYIYADNRKYSNRHIS